jgi:two-component system sensor histidine kinase/response regulator
MRLVTVALDTVMRILLVEDNRLNQELERDLLEAAGHTVDLAGDGTAMRACLADVTPDIILLDVLLPGTDGVALLGELRRSRHAALPVLAVTAQALPGDLERFTAAGFDAVVTKPIDTRTFVAEVERHAAGRRAGA